MYKEMAIIIIIIVAIFVGDFLTQRFTSNKVEYLTSELYRLKESITNASYNEANEKAEKLQNQIEDVHHKLSYYLEHNEIEKIQTAFTACKSYIKTEDYGDAICEVEKTIFLVNHLTDKYSFNLDNIF